MNLCSESLREDWHNLIAFVQENASHKSPDECFARCVLVAEDKRFLSHRGADPVALGRAFLRWLRGRPRGGASTIEMQLVRLVTNRRERTARRKVREILLACWLSRNVTKLEIFTAYMDNAYFGASLAGVEETSETIFKKNVSECNLAQKALLAALLVYPVPETKTIQWYRRVFRRARWILDRQAIVDPIARASEPSRTL